MGGPGETRGCVLADVTSHFVLPAMATDELSLFLLTSETFETANKFGCCTTRFCCCMSCWPKVNGGLMMVCCCGTTADEVEEATETGAMMLPLGSAIWGIIMGTP